MLESRAVDEGESVRRRRQCERCKKRFTTYERVKNNVLWVVKKNGTREPFEVEKVKRGVLRAVEKRPVSIDQVNKLLDQVEREMLRKQTEEVVSKQIGNAVLKRLKKLDQVSWLRFASVYLEFEDVKDFTMAIKE